MTEPQRKELEALMNLLEDPDHLVFDSVSNRLIELGYQAAERAFQAHFPGGSLA
jgi:hypothetical protein